MSLIRNISKYALTSNQIIIKECEGINVILTHTTHVDVKAIALQAASFIARQDAQASKLIIHSGMCIIKKTCTSNTTINILV